MLSTALAVAAAFTPAPCALPGMPKDYEREHRIECGWVAVPRSKEDDTPIRLWVAVARATEPKVGDSPLIYLNGGPGIATVDSLVPGIHEWKAFASLRKSRDVIFFDQRGSGRSEENFCPSLSAELNAISAAGLAPHEEAEQGRAAFAECRRAAESKGFDVEAYTTMNSVADLDAIRRAFGAPRTKLIAVSYGTMVAMQTMRAYPDTIEAALLNSPFPPNSASWAEQASLAADSYAAIDRACTAQPACRERFGQLVPKLEETLTRLEQEPLADGDKKITGRRFAAALWPLAVRSATVRYVPEAIHRAHAGDSELIRKMAGAFAGGDSFGTNSPAQGLAIMCHESGRTSPWYDRAKRLHPTLVSDEPTDTWDRNCAAYRPGYADPAFFAPVASDVPTLLYAGTFDPATPVVDAYHATRFLPRATVVEVPGASHAPMSLDDCTLGIALRFLDDPAATPDLTCMAGRVVPDFPTDGLNTLFEPAE